MQTLEQWQSDLREVPINEQNYWVYESLRPKSKLHIFGRYLFPHLIQGTQEPPECHFDLIKELTTPETSAIIFPREHAKSTWEKVDTIHDIVYGIEPVILYIGATSSDAEQHIGTIKFEIEYNKLLRQIYGNLVPDPDVLSRKWTERRIQTTNNVNLIARGRSKGRGVNIKGQRPTKIIIDDAEDDEMVKNPKQRTKFHDWLYNVIMNTVDSDSGYIKMIGTTLHDMCEVLQFYEKHGGIFRKAIEDGKSIWDYRWPLEKLEEKRKQIGTRAFMREYMNTSLPEDEAGIKRDWIIRANWLTLPLEHGFEGVIYIDPQAGESAQADEYSITVLYSEKQTPHHFCIEQPSGRASQNEQAREVVRAWLRHKKLVRLVGIEKVLNQTSVWQTLQEWKSRRISFNQPDTPPDEKIDESDRNIPICAWSPKGKDKSARLQMFEPAFERGEIHLRPEMLELQNQLMFLGTGNLDHDDRADSLVGALELAYHRGAGQKKHDVEQGEKKRHNTTIVGNIWKREF